MNMFLTAELKQMLIYISEGVEGIKSKIKYRNVEIREKEHIFPANEQSKYPIGTYSSLRI